MDWIGHLKSSVARCDLVRPIEEYSTCETNLKTEIRRSAHLDTSLRGILLVETILVFLWFGLEIIRRLSTNNNPIVPVVASGDTSSII